MDRYVANIGKLVTDNELDLKAFPLLEFLSQQELRVHFKTNDNHMSNDDIEKFHNTINEHVRILKHDFQVDRVEENIYICSRYY